MDSTQLYQAISDHMAQLYAQNGTVHQSFMNVWEQIQKLGSDLTKLNEVDPVGAQLAWQFLEQLRPKVNTKLPFAEPGTFRVLEE